MRKLWRWRLPAATLLAVTALCAQPAAEVGYIESFNGAQADYALRRPGKGQLQVSFLMAVFAGDEIHVNRQAKQIRLFLGGKPVTVCHPKTLVPSCERSPYTVKRAGKPPGVVAYLLREFAEIGRFLTQRHEEAQPGKAVPAVLPRGPEISVPLLDRGRVRLAAGDRALEIAWFGGAAPYRLTVSPRSGERAIVDLKSIAEFRARSRVVTLTPGSYVLRISDAKGMRYEKPFVVAPPSELPAFPRELLQEGLPHPLKETLQAAWLSSEGGGKWSWEAYLRVAGLPEGYPPAQALRGALEQGKRLPPRQETEMENRKQRRL